MEMWFSELHTSNVKLSMRIEKQLFSGNSDCQRIDVLESVEFGKFLALDGDILFSEKDEFIYDEMVTHVPMAVHPDVRHVLIIGGGDGGVAKELTQYDSIEKIDVVEPDEMLVEVCREHFPELACGLDDPRVNVYYQDGLRFLRNKTEEYDLIINDATDPFGHTEGLFTKEFYGSCYKALKEDGIMVYQHGSPFYDEDKEECMKMHRKAFRAYISNQQSVSGTYTNLLFRILAVWICFQKISPTQQSACERVEKITYQNKILYNESSSWSIHASKIFRRHARGRGRPVERIIGQQQPGNYLTK